MFAQQSETSTAKTLLSLTVNNKSGKSIKNISQVDDEKESEKKAAAGIYYLKCLFSSITTK